MSTVVLTPSHIASDHHIIRRCYPHQSAVDLDHRKIFLNPNKTMIVGTVGDYLPEQIDTEKTWHALSDIMVNVLSQLAVGGLVENKAIIKKGPALDHYEKIFDISGRTFIVTKQYRFVLTYSKIFDDIVASEVGPYCGIGSGGAIATGLLEGGIPLNKMWKALHHLDHLSSEEHTSLPLSILKNPKNLVSMMKRIRGEHS